VNAEVGAVCAEMGSWKEAERQFEVALQAVHNFVAIKAQGLEELGSKPTGFVSWEGEALKGWKYDISDLERLLKGVRCFSESSAVDGEDGAAEVQQTFSLGQNWPNPSNASATISYIVPASVYIGLKVYDIVGRQVATLAEAHRRAGAYRVFWEGIDKEGQQVPSEVYFCQLQAEKLRETKCMTLLR